MLDTCTRSKLFYVMHHLICVITSLGQKWYRIRLSTSHVSCSNQKMWADINVRLEPWLADEEAFLLLAAINELWHILCTSVIRADNITFLKGSQTAMHFSQNSCITWKVSNDNAYKREVLAACGVVLSENQLDGDSCFVHKLRIANIRFNVCLLSEDRQAPHTQKEGFCVRMNQTASSPSRVQMLGKRDASLVHQVCIIRNSIGYSLWAYEVNWSLWSGAWVVWVWKMGIHTPEQTTSTRPWCLIQKNWVLLRHNGTCTQCNKVFVVRLHCVAIGNYVPASCKTTQA